MGDRVALRRIGLGFDRLGPAFKKALFYMTVYFRPHTLAVDLLDVLWRLHSLSALRYCAVS